MRFTPRRARRRRQRNFPSYEQFEDRRLLAAVLTVNSTADSDARDSFLTLRESILVSNRTLAVGTLSVAEQAQVSGTPTAMDTDTIAFNIPATDPRHVYYPDDGRSGKVSRVNLSTNLEHLLTTTTTDDALIPTSGPQAIDPDWAHSWYSIQVASALPAITEAVTIDGLTQTGAIANSNPVVGAYNGNLSAFEPNENSVLRIELTIAAAASANGLTITSSGSTVRGLVIQGFGRSANDVGTGFPDSISDGVEITATGNKVVGSHLGADVSGLTGLGNGYAGVFVNGAADNIVGGSTPADRVLARRNPYGVAINGVAATGNSVLGSVLGPDNFWGVLMDGGAFQNSVGGSAAGAGNMLVRNGTGVRFSGTGTSDNSVLGNFIGFVNNIGIQIDPGNDNNHIGGLTDTPGTAAGNVISGNIIGLEIMASGTSIQGNLIGGYPTGEIHFPNLNTTLRIEGDNSLIGGSDVRARNVISGESQDHGGITLNGNGTVVQNNFIGTDITGTADHGNQGGGILLLGSDNRIEANVIAFNRLATGEAPPPGSGITIRYGTGNVITANSIFSNEGLGIQLGQSFGPNPSPTLNDLGDADGGPNNLQNYPVITSVTTGATSVIDGTLNSTANGTFRVELFASAAADPSGFGEGQTYLGFTTVTTDGSGNGSFSFSPSAPVAGGQIITSTATDAAGNTSEFSGLVVVPDQPLTLSINDVSASEGVSGTTAFAFTVTLSANPSSNVTVMVNTADGTTNPAMTADGDYPAISNLLLTFVPNSPLTQTVTVNVAGDSKFERDETFFVNLSSPTGATIADGQGLGTIQNDDLAPTLSFSANNSVLEGNVAGDDRQVPFTITLSAVSGVDVTGTISTTSGSATEGTDFAIADGVTFTIPAGQTQATVLVSVIEDTTFEADEQFTIDATVTDPSTVSNGGGTASGTGTIENDDQMPSVSIDDISLSEGISGITSFTFTVTLSANPSSNVTVTVNTTDGTTNPATTVDNDYAAITNFVLTFVPNGPLTQTVTVNVAGDNKFERDETFFVNLSSPTGATLADGQGLGTIQNDDLAPTLSFSTNNSVLEGNVAGDDRKVPFTISLSAVSGVDVMGTISTASGTATEGTDFESADGVAFVIPAGQTQATILVSVIEDTDVEADEQFTIEAVVSDPSTVSNSNGHASGTGILLNDDSASDLPVSIGSGCHGPALIINGSEAGDTIRVVARGNDAVRVLINGQSYGYFASSSFQEILVYGKNGDDDIELAGSIGTRAFLFGEAGNDRLKGGNGANMLVGGNGDDYLIGSQAADVLIGGDGSDRLVGNGGDDLLIAGWTDHDTNLAALCAILDEWSRTDVSYETRVNNLQVGGGLNGSVLLNNLTVHDDGDIDRLTGSAGRDWFFANMDFGVLDEITDLHPTELVDDIDA